MAINIQRFFGLPNVLKPILLLLILLVMIIAVTTSFKKGEGGETGGWFFWITTLLQLVFMSGVCVLFLFEMELLATCGRDQWPLLEMVYSGVFAIIDIINMFIVASWNKHSETRAPIVSSLFIFALVILYGLGGAMMFRIWRGDVKAGASQNPTDTVQPGNPGQMHPAYKSTEHYQL